MRKGHWIVQVDVHDPASYQNYLDANGAAFKKYGGRFLVRGGAFEATLGRARKRNVVLEFKDYQTALACFHSPEYQRTLAARGKSAEVDHLVIEGYDGPQPADG